MASSRRSRLRWTRSGAHAAVLALAGASCIAGFVLIAQARDQRVVVRARLGDVVLQLNRVTWVHHPKGDEATPQAMMPGMPVRGQHRLHVEFTVENEGRFGEAFRIEEIELRNRGGLALAAVTTEAPYVHLGTGQRVANSVDFDVAEGERSLKLCWRRGDAGEKCLVPLDAPVPAAETKAVKAPTDVARLPPGDVEAGRQLFNGKAACVSCHGGQAQFGYNQVGPDLSRIGAVAETRAPGKSGAQYIYESILDPNAFVSPTCPDGPCASPSAMPFYGDRLSLQDFADLVAYLSQRR